ncbi:MAG: GH31 [uncultured Solirubrobacterales bacterium]|uniref:GH31 n=1 Tax=uncultured Solirubrobacterales bacterium TaxID=768556 RepID=A0A6J4S0R8_9ACTN|nr:MAG: GH31 [uncultured Solirubrobacterales bacterium]
MFALAATGAPPPAGAQAAPKTIELDAGNGETLRVERGPFRLALVDRSGRETVATVSGREGAPVRVPGVDGPQPIEPLGPAGGYPALGFVVGANPGVTFPVSFFTGNRLFGAEAGALVSLVEVERVERTPRGLRLRVRTDAPALGPATLEVVRLSGGGVRLDLRPPAGLRPAATLFTLRSPKGEGLYGLGARKDRFDQRGLLRNVWVEQQNASDDRADDLVCGDPTTTTGCDYTFPNGAQAAYFVQAALHGSRGWAAWVGQSTLSRLDLANSRSDALRWGVKGPRLTLSLAGGGLEGSSRSYTADAGRAPAPPRYTYEPWIDVINEGEGEAAPNGAGFTGGERVREDVEEIARRARTDDLPIGTIGVEGWHAVPGREELFPGLRRRGFHLSAYWNPFHSPGNAAYEEAKRRDIFIKTPTGEDYPILTNRGGRSFVIDYSHPRARQFWHEQIARSCELGFESFMHDFGELVTEGMTFHNGNPPEVEHNAYPVRYHRAARSALERCADRKPGFDPFFYVRAGYSGIERDEGVVGSTPGVFPGDETTDFARGSGIPSVPPAMLNMAMGGGFSFTTDVGGYLDLTAPRTSPELFVRWSQLAAFTAISRIHNSTFNGEVYPYTCDDPAREDADYCEQEGAKRMLPVYRRYAKAKVRLIGLVDRWSKRAARDGTIGPVRPLVLDDPSPAARSVDDEWLLGRDLLVAPVLRDGARERRVYLPAGSRWQRVVVGGEGRLEARGEARRGGQTVTAPAPLADIPVFRRVEAAGGGGPADGGGPQDGSGGGSSSDGGGSATDDGEASESASANREGAATTSDRADDDRSSNGDRTGGATPTATDGDPSATPDTEGDGSLPFTGFSLAVVAAAGLVLAAGGALLRRRAR